MKIKLLISAITLALYANARAQMLPIIDAQYGYLIGAVENGKWIESDKATKSVKAGTKLQVFGAAGQVGTAAIVKLDTAGEACPDRSMVKLNPKKVKNGGIAFGAKWNPLPRKPQPVDNKDKKYVDLVRAFLYERGLKDPVVQITQAVRIDIDGDGQDEIVISATHYNRGVEIPDEPAPNTYSFVMLARFAQGKTETKLVAGEFYPDAKSEMPANKFEIAAVLDLNGDGKLEIVVRSAYYEGHEVTVYEYKSSRFNKALSAGCGL